MACFAQPRRFFCCLSLELGAKIIAWVSLIICLVALIWSLVYAIYDSMDGYYGRYGYYGYELTIFFINLIYLVTIILLLFGIYRNRAQFICIWIIAAIIYIIAKSITLLLLEILVVRRGTGAFVGFLFGYLIYIALHIYCILIVMAYKNQLSEPYSPEV